MNLKTKRFLIIFILAIILVLATGIFFHPNGEEGVLSATDLSYQLSLAATAPLQLFPGEEVYQYGDQVLFLSSNTLERPSTTAVAFSITDQKELWTVDLPSPPVQAVAVEAQYLIATTPGHDSGSEAHVVAVEVNDGRIVWDQALGKALTALAVGEDGRIWLAYESGVAQIDPITGELSPAIQWPDDVQAYGEQRAITTYQNANTQHLAVSASSRIFDYEETITGWQMVWEFQSKKRVLELHPVTWNNSEPPHLLALAHSIVYDIGPDGTAAWRVENSDYNRDAQLISCSSSDSPLMAFRNVISGIYLVGEQGVVQHWDMPGGSAHLGPIPLPFSKNLAFGLSVADLKADGRDELIVRSLEQLFVFDCDAALLAVVNLQQEGVDKIVAQMRTGRLHHPLIYREYVIVPNTSQIEYFTLKPWEE